MSTKIQRGYIFRVKKSWFGRWYRDEIEAGEVVRRQHSEKLADVCDRYRSKKDVRPLLDEKLVDVNAGTASAESTMTIADYADKFFFPYAEREAAKEKGELKPSTVNGYKILWRAYLRARVTKLTLRDFSCGKATKLLADLYADKKLSRTSLRHVKALLATIFTFAKRNDVIAGENPVRDAGIPRAAVAGETHAYLPQAVSDMFAAFDQQRKRLLAAEPVSKSSKDEADALAVAKTAIALMFFTGLRPGESRGAMWSDLDEAEKTISIRRSVWRTHETTPKTEESVGKVPVCEALTKILAETPHTSKYILATPSGKPVDLHNLAARVIRPALAKCATCGELHEKQTAHELKAWPTWHGFYALRRGAATMIAELDTMVAAKSLLRHSNIATTQRHYTKSVDASAARAVDKLSSLFDTGNVPTRPN